ncbi:MAG TPA: hypothetical protein VNT42_07240 [Sphingomonas sp.]|nr:hypothetical protein [Sphingomonas sp.]
MTKLAIIACAAAIAAPAIADTPLAFTFEGHKIVGTVSEDGAVQLIKGRDLTTGRDFELRVKNGYVDGEMGGQYVSFKAPKRKLSPTNAG